MPDPDEPTLMEALYLLIPLSVILIAGVSWVFLRMVSQGQFDDLDSPAQSILLDDDGLVGSGLNEPIPLSPRREQGTDPAADAAPRPQAAVRF